MGQAKQGRREKNAESNSIRLEKTQLEDSTSKSSVFRRGGHLLVPAPRPLPRPARLPVPPRRGNGCRRLIIHGTPSVPSAAEVHVVSS